MLSAYHARANSLKTHGFLSSTYLTLHPAARRDVMLFHVDSGLFLALLMTLNQTDLSPYKSYLSGSGAQSYWTSFHGISILPPQECHECYFSGSGARSRWTSFHGISFFLRNLMSAISVVQVCRVAELAFMGFLHPPQECRECYFSGSGPQSRWTTIVVKSCWESCVHHFTLHLIPLFELLAVLFGKWHALVPPHPIFNVGIVHGVLHAK